MVKNIKDIELNQDTFKSYIKTLNSPAKIGKRIRSPKYLFIDWEGWRETSFNFNMLEEDDIHIIIGSIEYIACDDFVNELYKFIDNEAEEFLWGSLVDNHIISDRFYQSNTYDDNLTILNKMREKINLKS